jgi:phenylacetate-CoA ligase
VSIADSIPAVASYWKIHREQWLPADRLEELQWRRFRAILRHAYDRSPFYRRTMTERGLTPSDIRSREDLVRLPITTRESLRHPDEMIVHGHDRETLKRSMTSGSTGRVTVSYFDDRAWITGKYLLKARARLACGVRPWDRIALLQESDHETNRVRTGRPRLRSFSIMVPIPEIIPELERYAPTVLYGFPGYLSQLGRQLRGEIAPSKIFTSGEMLDRKTRDSIEGCFGAPVYDVYGCTEIKEIAWQCDQRAAYHINADRILVETVDDDGFTSRSEGRILVTSLYNFAMPLIRYELGDTGSLSARSCACGRGLPLMTPHLGRSVDSFRLPDGTLVPPYAMTCAIESIEGMRQYQIVQETLDRVVVNVVPLPGFETGSSQELAAVLTQTLHGATVEVRIVEQIPREKSGKYRIVRSHVTGA